MKSQPQINSQSLTYAFGGVLLAGAIASGLTTSDNRWLTWHFSRLGEGGTLSSFLFNLSLVIAALIFYKLGKILNSNIKKIDSSDKSKNVKAENVIEKSFIAITVCMIGVAIFPFDRHPLAHDFFGYSILIIFLALCLMMYRVLPIFSLNFNIYSNFVMLSTIVCYILFFGFSVITLLVVESVIFISLYIWMIMFIKGIDKKVAYNTA